MKQKDRSNMIGHLVQLQKMLDGDNATQKERVTIAWCLGACQAIFEVSDEQIANAIDHSAPFNSN